MERVVFMIYIYIMTRVRSRVICGSFCEAREPGALGERNRDGASDYDAASGEPGAVGGIELRGGAGIVGMGGENRNERGVSGQGGGDSGAGHGAQRAPGHVSAQ